MGRGGLHTHAGAAEKASFPPHGGVGGWVHPRVASSVRELKLKGMCGNER